MTNYNDGKWHGWNGGECPAHPMTLVKVVYLDDGLACIDEAIAKYCDFSANADLPIIAFRVIKEHREPREWWVCYDPATEMFFQRDEKPNANDRPLGPWVHVREVLE